MPTNPRAGFYKIAKTILDDEDLKSMTAEQRGIWFTIMSQCYRNWNPWEFRGQPIPPFSMITTQSNLLELCNMGKGDKRSRIRRTLNLLSSFNWIKTTVVYRKFTIITLCRAKRWQAIGGKKSQPRENQTETKKQPRERKENQSVIPFLKIAKTKAGPETDHRTVEVRKKQKPQPASGPQSGILLERFSEEHPARTIAQQWYEWRITNNVYIEKKGQSFEVDILPQWADALDKLNRLDGLSWDKIIEMIGWIQRSDFWWNKACPLSLRKRKDKSDDYKWQKIQTAMASNGYSRKRQRNTKAQETRIAKTSQQHFDPEYLRQRAIELGLDESD
jgi:hypothetical protein